MPTGTGGTVFPLGLSAQGGSLGLYDENFKAREEEELRIRFEKKYKIQNLCVPLYRYWIHDNNLTKNNMKMDFFKDKLTKKHG